VRNVTNSVGGSHPVGIVLTNYTNSVYFKLSSTNLPLEKTTGKLRCETCHDVHYSAANDGSLTRITNRTSLCIECHTLAQTVTNLPAAHLAATNSLMLWPGGQYGTAFPQITDATKRGTCVNCHQPHGWPDAANSTNHYAKLLVDYQENLCFTCHDTNGPAVENVRDDFYKSYHHPVQNSEQFTGRSVECTDCHNPHKALANAHTYSSTNIYIRTVTNSGAGLFLDCRRCRCCQCQRHLAHHRNHHQHVRSPRLD
jgi:predicted CXXCH cytochrome family protein